MSSSQTNYKLDEAQAIFNELRSIKKAISTGEKERQDLIQVSLFSPSSLKIMLTCSQFFFFLLLTCSILTSSVCQPLLLRLIVYY